MKKILWISALILTLSACQDNIKKEKEAEKELQPKAETKTAKPAFDHKAYKMKGMIIAKNTFKVFKSNIQAVVAKDGLPGVVDFCHDNAMKLTDSLGKSHNVVIKRTSHKLRNSENKPDIDSEAVINEYLRLQEEQNNMEPVVMKDADGYVHFYAPIKLKKECLKCHGTPGKEIPEPVYKLIKSKYPNDKATGFKVGELRGIWDIKFLDMADK